MAIQYKSGEEKDVGSGGGGPLEPGEYELVVKNAIEGESKNGNPMITVDLEVIGKGRNLKEFLVFTPTSIWKIDLFRKAMGEVVNPNEDVSVDAKDWIGKTTKVNLSIEPDRNDPTKKWNRIESYILNEAPF
jgi:hypothetical protein